MKSAADAIGTAGALGRALGWPSASGRALQWQLTIRSLVRLLAESTLPMIAAAVATAALPHFVLRNQFARLGLSGVVGPELGLVLVREIAPVVASLILLTRTVSGLAAEMATQQVEGEFDAIDAAGLSSVELLLAPRAAALIIVGGFTMLVLTMLAVYTEAALSLLIDQNLGGSTLDILRATFSPWEPIWIVALGMTAGGLLALVTIRASLGTVARSDVPAAVRRTAITGLVAVLLLHGFDAVIRLSLK